jgi:hypothetical protein
LLDKFYEKLYHPQWKVVSLAISFSQFDTVLSFEKCKEDKKRGYICWTLELQEWRVACFKGEITINLPLEDCYQKVLELEFDPGNRRWIFFLRV